MKQKTVEVKLKQGLEARPVAMLVQVASKHASNIYLESEGSKVNAKSIMGTVSYTHLGFGAGSPGSGKQSDQGTQSEIQHTAQG